MKKLNTTSKENKTVSSTSAPAGIQPIRYWQQKWEQYLLLTRSNRATYERYSRAVQRFLDHFKDKRYPHSYLRPHVLDYLQDRLSEGANPNTIRLELSAVRSFWNWMMAMEVVDVFFNPANSVKVPNRPSSSFAKAPGDGVGSPSGEADVSTPSHSS